MLHQLSLLAAQSFLTHPTLARGPGATQTCWAAGSPSWPLLLHRHSRHASLLCTQVCTRTLRIHPRARAVSLCLRRVCLRARLALQWSDASCVIYVFDVCNETSFAAVENWIQKTKLASGERDDIPGEGGSRCCHGIYFAGSARRCDPLRP